MSSFTRPTTRAVTPTTPRTTSITQQHLRISILKTTTPKRNRAESLKVKASVNVDDSSYLGMWKKAVDRKRKEDEFKRISENVAEEEEEEEVSRLFSEKEVERKSRDFEKILGVSEKERDVAQQQQTLNRAQAAIAAARAVLKTKTFGKDNLSLLSNAKDNLEIPSLIEDVEDMKADGEMHTGPIFVPRSEKSGKTTPGPDFESWSPPSDNLNSDSFSPLLAAKSSPTFQAPELMEKERSFDVLPLPFESELTKIDQTPHLPPLQSLMEVEKSVEVTTPTQETESLKEELLDHDVKFSTYEKEAADALHKMVDLPSEGVNPDGSRWWKVTGVEERTDNVICRWTMIRGVSADQETEWQNKYWEASNEVGFKELGSEKLGRDATGSVWREHWIESMWEESGLLHMEKTADKWGKNGQGDEWQEKWFEQYDASGKTEKWAHKWCSIDPNTPVDDGHAHVWHERWGEQYDGHGGSTKYTDKWAERCEGDGWTKWGDKWDEHFDPNAHGVKQGETWWEGKYGERWNRTWGEGHNNSGWVHKYGQSSSGDHWDIHAPEDTWYERFPHFGFYHCFENSVQLREVPTPSELPELE
ncbi:hypothetical protein ACFE04_006892 [Oxalis oulophora]